MQPPAGTESLQEVNSGGSALKSRRDSAFISRSSRRRAPDRCQADNESVLDNEMIGPVICARIEESDKLPRVWIYAGDVRTLVVIASSTCPGEVGDFIAAPMLICDDVLEVKDAQVDCCF